MGRDRTRTLNTLGNPMIQTHDGPSRDICHDGPHKTKTEITTSGLIFVHKVKEVKVLYDDGFLTSD